MSRGRHSRRRLLRLWAYGDRWIERHHDGPAGPLGWRGWFLIGYGLLIAAAFVWIVTTAT